MGSSELNCFTCTTSFVFIFSISVLAVNILGYQYAEADDLDAYPDDGWYVIYRWDEIYVETTVTRPVTKQVVEDDTTYTYEEMADYLCSNRISQDFCDGLDRLRDGGEQWHGLTIAGLVVVLLAIVLQCLWILTPSVCPICTHYVVSACCLISAILFWAAFGAWQSAFDDNKATDAILDYVFGKVITVNPTESWQYLDATIGASTILLLICSILALIAMFVSFKFSYDRVTQNAFDFENMNGGVQDTAEV